MNKAPERWLTFGLPGGVGWRPLLSKPILDRVNQALLDQLAAEGGPPIYTLTPEREYRQEARKEKYLVLESRAACLIKLVFNEAALR